jgi:ankyrin repeat protein
MTPLHIACKKGRQEMVSLLLKNQAEVNARDKVGKTPLFYALHTASICKALMKAGAFSDISVALDKSMTPLHYAICNGNMDTIRELLETGANVNKGTSEGMTPLHLAVKEAAVTIHSEYKYEPHIDSYIIDNVSTQYRTVKRTLLFTFETIGKYSMLLVIEKLISKGADIHARDIYGRLPLDLSYPTLEPQYTGSDVKDLRTLLGLVE